jgi:hypothetical protein
MVWCDVTNTRPKFSIFSAFKVTSYLTPPMPTVKEANARPRLDAVSRMRATQIIKLLGEMFGYS